MPYSYVQTTGDGTTNIVSVPFDYLRKAHVHVYVDGLEVLDTLNWLTEGTIELPRTPITLWQRTILLRRITPAEELITVFSQEGFDPEDLNQVLRQVFFLAQEAWDRPDLERLTVPGLGEMPTSQDKFNETFGPLFHNYLDGRPKDFEAAVDGEVFLNNGSVEVKTT